MIQFRDYTFTVYKSGRMKLMLQIFFQVEKEGLSICSRKRAIQYASYIIICAYMSVHYTVCAKVFTGSIRYFTKINDKTEIFLLPNQNKGQKIIHPSDPTVSVSLSLYTGLKKVMMFGRKPYLGIFISWADLFAR